MLTTQEMWNADADAYLAELDRIAGARRLAGHASFGGPEADFLKAPVTVGRMPNRPPDGGAGDPAGTQPAN